MTRTSAGGRYLLACAGVGRGVGAEEWERTSMRRAVIYLRTGRDRDETAQRACCLRYIDEHAYQVVAVAHDGPGTCIGWVDASRMVADGEADVVVVASRGLIPALVPVEEARVLSSDDPRRPHRLDV